MTVHVDTSDCLHGNQIAEADSPSVDRVTPVVKAGPATLHGLFEAQARRTPRAPAVICGDQQLSYGELEARATAVARHLRNAGVERGSLVGLHAERSLELAVGLLGIAKTGAAYVPLDPLYPRDRLAFMLADSSVQVVLTARHLAKSLPPSDARLVFVEEMPAPERDPGGEPEDSGATGHDLAYVMYTSGSTGRPKGVMIEHGAVVNTIVDINERFAITADDRVLALSSYAFDLSVYDYFGLWAAGGCVVIPQAPAERAPACWAQLLATQRVTVWNSVPSSMEMLLAHQANRRDGALASLRLVLLSGDWIPVSLPDRVRAINSHAQLVSLGGATEASIWSILYPIGACDPRWRSIPYGCAMKNQSMLVLNEQLRACGPGEVGQLYIGGVGLARGYLNRPELTKERFVTNVVRHQPAARFYATGDLGRWLPDGTIEFLGRTDGQVKIRGYRVELGEVESALSRHPAIQNVVALAQERGGHKHLVAFYTSGGRSAPRARELRDFLRRTLPDYMVPAKFVMLARMPLSANGKIDRNALGELERHARRPAALKAPVYANEQRLAAIWQESFALEHVGMDDDFFDLGGNSLLAAVMFARIEQEFGQALSFDVLLERPTIRALARALESRCPALARSSLVRIQAGDARTPLFCLPGIGGNVLGFRALVGWLEAGQSVYGLPPVGFGDGQEPHQTIGEMAAHSIRSMRVGQPHGPYYLVGYSLGGVVAFEMAQQLRAAGETVALLALVDSQLWSPPAALSLAQRLRLHWRKTVQTDAAERRSYLRERWRVVAERLRRRSLRHAEEDLVAGLDLPEAHRETARAHWSAWRNYWPRRYNGPITLFIAEEDPELASTANGRDPTLGWDRWTTDVVQVHRASATHANVLRAKEMQHLSDLLGRGLSVDSRGIALTGSVCEQAEASQGVPADCDATT